MALESPTPEMLRVESWTMYSIGLIFILLRMYSRSMVLGSWKNLQIDDYVMMFDGMVYTLLMASINISGRTATNLLAPGEFETLTPEDIQIRIYGSKIVIVLEQAMLICTWLTKACMLMLYHRLSQRLPHQLAIKWISGYVVLGFIACELAWFLNCRPLTGYWALPVPHAQCATYQRYSIVQATFNLTSDLMMLGVGIPLLMKARVEFKKKLLLVGIFGLGVFVILAAVLNKYHNFSNPLTTIYMLWYIRESSTAIYVANIPMLWPLFRRFLKVGSFAGSSSGSHGDNSASHKYLSRVGTQLSKLSRMSKKPSAPPVKGTKMTVTDLGGSFAGSEEEINRPQPDRLEIDRRVSFTVVEEGDRDIDLERFGNEGLYKANITSGSPALERL